jgi:uncharacterized paraquat-inducible protein A
MECPNCHVKNKDDSRFCGRCAVPLNVEETLPASLTQTLAWFDKYLGPVKR